MLGARSDTSDTHLERCCVCSTIFYGELQKYVYASSNNMTEKALCGLLEGLNVQSSEPIFLRASQNRSDGECNHETPTLSVRAAKGGTFDDGSGGGSASPVDLVTQGGIILGSVQNNSYPHGRILKFAIDSVTFDSQTGKPSLINPRFLGVASKSKLKAFLSAFPFTTMGQEYRRCGFTTCSSTGV